MSDSEVYLSTGESLLVLLSDINLNSTDSNEDTIGLADVKKCSVLLVFSLCYVLFLLIGLFRLYSNSTLWRHTTNTDAMAVYMYSLLSAFSCCRASFFIYGSVVCLVNNKTHFTHNFLLESLLTFGSLFLNWGFLVILQKWAEMASKVYHDLHNEHSPTKQNWQVFIAVTLLLFVTSIFSFAMYEMYLYKWLYIINLTGLAFVSSCSLTLVPMSGYRMCQLLKRIGEQSKRRIKNITILSCIAVVFFLTRALSESFLCYIVLNTHYWKWWTPQYSAWFFYCLVKYVFEILIVFMLYYMLPWKVVPSNKGYHHIPDA